MKCFSTEKKYRAIIVLSGPEPQRTFLEKKLLRQLETLISRQSLPPQYKNVFCFVRGISNQHISMKQQPTIELHDVLTTGDLNQKIMESDVVICRSGYSSLMDLVALQKPAILIPTEGQTEQEYLADTLARQNRFICQTQNNLNLEFALSEVPKMIGFTDFLQENDDKPKTLQQVVHELLEF
jgi:UDP-N-acetylglucosamine:LPS N-acetylglucosamine transferase